LPTVQQFDAFSEFKLIQIRLTPAFRTCVSRNLFSRAVWGTSNAEGEEHVSIAWKNVETAPISHYLHLTPAREEVRTREGGVGRYSVQAIIGATGNLKLCVAVEDDPSSRIGIQCRTRIKIVGRPVRRQCRIRRLIRCQPRPYCCGNGIVGTQHPRIAICHRRVDERAQSALHDILDIPICEGALRGGIL